MSDPREKFVSDEEWYFSWWIDELIEAGFIESAIYQPYPYLLSPEKTVRVRKPNGVKKGKVSILDIDYKVFNQHVYTADWDIRWSIGAYGVFVKPIKLLANKDEEAYFVSNFETSPAFSVIDVKGSFNGKNNTSAATFPLNQKWVYDKYGVYVQKVIPLYYTKNKQGKRIAHGLFADTFTPSRYLMQNERINAKRTIHYEPRSLADYLKSRSCLGLL